MKLTLSKRFYGLVAALAICSAIVPSAASATTATGSFSVTASVPKNCSLSAPTLAFGSYDVVGTQATSPLDGSSTLSIKCTKGTGAAVYVQGGLGSNSASASGSCAVATCTRAMTDGTDFLSYDLYTVAYTTVWSPTATSGTSVFSFDFSSSSATQTATISGEIPAGEDVGVGSYTDSITMTANF